MGSQSTLITYLVIPKIRQHDMTNVRFWGYFRVLRHLKNRHNSNHYSILRWFWLLYDFAIRPRHRFFILRSLRECASPDPRQAPTVRTHFFMASGVIFSLSLTSWPSGDFMVTIVQKPGFHFFFLRLYPYHPITHILLKMRAEKGVKEVNQNNALYQSHLTDNTLCARAVKHRIQFLRIICSTQ